MRRNRKIQRVEAPDARAQAEAAETRSAYERQGRRWEDQQYRSWMPGNVLIAQERERVMLDLLRREGMLPLTDKRILDVGCGVGKELIRFVARGARPENLRGIDVQEDLVAEARALAPNIDVRVGDATRLPFEDASFDLVLAFVMLSSMRSDESRRLAAAEMLRVTAPTGCVLVYDFALNPGNRDVQPIRPRDLQRLFAGAVVTSRRVTPAPPLARAVARRSWYAATLLGTIPMLRTHRLMIARPAAA